MNLPLYNVELRRNGKWHRWDTDNDLEVQRTRFDYMLDMLQRPRGTVVDYDAVRLVNLATKEILSEGSKDPTPNQQPKTAE